MNVEVRNSATIASTQASRLAIADCDMHLGPRSLDELKPFLSSRILHHIETYGMAHRVPGRTAIQPFRSPRLMRRGAMRFLLAAIRRAPISSSRASSIWIRSTCSLA